MATDWLTANINWQIFSLMQFGWKGGSVMMILVSNTGLCSDNNERMLQCWDITPLRSPILRLRLSNHCWWYFVLLSVCSQCQAPSVWLPVWRNDDGLAIPDRRALCLGNLGLLAAPPLSTVSVSPANILSSRGGQKAQQYKFAQVCNK